MWRAKDGPSAWAMPGEFLLPTGPRENKARHPVTTTRPRHAQAHHRHPTLLASVITTEARLAIFQYVPLYSMVSSEPGASTKPACPSDPSWDGCLATRCQLLCPTGAGIMRHGDIGSHRLQRRGTTVLGTLIHACCCCAPSETIVRQL